MNDNKISLLLRTAIGHYYFGYIHPFYDGNGRTGRFISSMYIKEDYGYLTAMSLARGSFLKKNDYYKAFDITNSVKNKGELNCFVDTFLSRRIVKSNATPMVRDQKVLL
ncbi:Fic family protein [Peptoniphilus asaccharolyticus]|uniref:Fic family protein n=1 Tax=Peptoniphilus asaccharolyticus TaxID=1258 RepID=UPI00193339F9|nr:Fic family protein [Peptoniphilus asaccharolyticus]MBL7574412.1 Fic family protein [Peptoniphilus asaccharolyticus]